MPTRIIVLTASLIFVLLRLGIILTAVDHISHASAEELHLCEWARRLVQGEPVDNPLPHLWGFTPTVYALAGLMKLGATDVQAAKFLALIVSLFGFVCLLLLFARRAGPWPTALLAALLIFPNRRFLKWSLMVWGGYPESAHLIAAALLLYGWSVSSPRPLLLWLTGLVGGLVVGYSPSVLYVPLAIGLTLLLPAPLPRWWHLGAMYLFGLFVGLAPRLLIFASDVRNRLFEYNALFDRSEPVSYFEVFTRPDWLAVKKLLLSFHYRLYFPEEVEFPLLVVSLAAVLLYHVVRRRDLQDDRWQLVCPLGLLLGPLVISLFAYAKNLWLRHLLWFYPAGYVVIALFCGISYVRADQARWPRFLAVCERLLKLAAVGLLVVPHARQILPLVQPDEFGILSRYRGDQYRQRGIFTVIGDEVQSVNCVLDRLPERVEPSHPFTFGFRDAFQVQGSINDFFWLSYRPLDDPKQLWPREDAGRTEYFRGLGCALAVKPNTRSGDMEILERTFGAEAAAAAREGSSLCASLDCLPAAVRGEPPAR